MREEKTLWVSSYIAEDPQQPFSAEILKARREKHNIFKAPKGKKEPRFYPSKLSLRIREKELLRQEKDGVYHQ